MPTDLEAAIAAFVRHYNYGRKEEQAQTIERRRRHNKAPKVRES